MKTYSVTLDGKEALQFKATFDNALQIFDAFKSSTPNTHLISLNEIEES